MTPAQCRAARAMVEISQDGLAEASGVHAQTIFAFESGKRAPYRSTLDKLRAALEAAGVVFLDPNGNGPGVALKRDANGARSPAGQP